MSKEKGPRQRPPFHEMPNQITTFGGLPRTCVRCRRLASVDEMRLVFLQFVCAAGYGCAKGER